MRLRCTLELECCQIHHQARAGVHDVLDFGQAVGLERLAGAVQNDEDVGQALVDSLAPLLESVALVGPPDPCLPAHGAKVQGLQDEWA